MAETNPPISTFVFMKIHTTGRNWEREPMRITEVCMHAVPRETMESADFQKAGLPGLVDFCTLVQPGAPISKAASEATQINSYALDTEPSYQEIMDYYLMDYLNGLPRPVCLVAHNGNSFDFKVLRIETERVWRRLPDHLLMVDFRWIFHNLLKAENAGSDVKIKSSLEAVSQSLDVKFKGRMAESWVRTMIGCVMKRPTEFVERADAKYRSFY